MSICGHLQVSEKPNLSAIIPVCHCLVWLKPPELHPGAALVQGQGTGRHISVVPSNPGQKLSPPSLFKTALYAKPTTHKDAFLSKVAALMNSEQY